MAQDQEGFIWLGTPDGLYKYDGYQSTSYRNIPGDSSSLDNNWIESIFIDSRNDIWVGTITGLNRYNPGCDCFFRYPSLHPGYSVQVNTFAEDSTGNIWMGTQENGLFRYERESGRFAPILDDPKNAANLLDDQVRVLLADNQNRLWIGTGEPFDLSITGGGLIRLDLFTEKAKRFLHDPANPHSLLDNRVNALAQDQEGRIWAGTCQNGLHYYDEDKEIFIRMMPDAAHPNGLHAPTGGMGQWASCPHVRIIHQMQNGDFWVGTFNGGLYHFNPSTDKGTLYRHNPNNPNSLINNNVWNAFEDRQGRLWILNLDSGIHKMDPSLHKFKVHGHNPIEPASLPFNDLLGIYEAPSEPGFIWLGTNGGGLIRLNTLTDEFIQYRHQAHNEKSIGSDIVWTTYEDRNGVFWVGTEAGLSQMNRQTGEFRPVALSPGKASEAASLPVTQMFEDQEGRFWVGTWSGGLFRLGRNKSVSKQYHFSEGSLQTYYNSIYSIHEDSKGAIWAGSYKGDLCRYDPTQDRFVPQLKGFGTTCLHEDGKSCFWIGTEGSGLLYFNPSDGSFRQFLTVDGLPGNRVLGILEDGQGFYWISTTSGLAKFNPRSGEFQNFGLNDGLPGTEFNTVSAFKSSSGQFYFGGVKGLVSFLPEKVRGNPSAPDVLINNLHIAGTPYFARGNGFGQAAKIKLNHSQNDLTFDYVGLHYTDPSSNTYQYKLAPYDKDWIPAGTQRTARYTNLNPGAYTFQVTAANSDGVWNKQGASLHFYIAPPWWTRWWACALYLSVIGASIYGIYHFQLSKKIAIEESKRHREIHQLTTNLYTNITHEFRTPLTVIQGMADELKNNPQNEPEKKLGLIKKNSQRLLSLVNQMLDLSKLQAGKMVSNLRQDDIILFIKHLVESYESFAQLKNIGLQFYSEEEGLLMDFSAKGMEQILTNLISNAVKFTPEYGKILVVAKKNISAGKPFLEIKIKDNGIGISREQLPSIFNRFHQANPAHENQGSGIGLALVKELMNAMGGKIKVESELEKGTVFSLLFPVQNNAPLAVANTGHDFKVPVLPVLADKQEQVSSDDGLPILLIVEDNADVTYYLKTCLEKDYQILVARNGKKGLKKAQEILPDIIICDVMMPEIDGFEVCKILKEDERTSHIPIILLTAKATTEDKLTGLQYGADAYLTKPFEKEELLIRLEKLREVRSKLQKKYSSTLISRQAENDAPRDKEDLFIQKIESIILGNLDNEEFSAHKLSRELHLSRSQAHRKIKALTGMSTAIYIRHIRLQKARELLSSTDLTISEIAYQAGFKTPVYFSQSYKEVFGESPSATRK
ncbi:MAG: response regulator [Lewinellaceae bacterium]|nr:response regulator [Lewinellaceae bacterium]